MKIRLPQQPTRRTARLLVSGNDKPVRVADGMGTIEIDSILDHEVIVVG